MAIEIGFAIGALVLLAALVYAVHKYERRDPRNERLTAAATRAVYKQEQ